MPIKWSVHAVPSTTAPPSQPLIPLVTTSDTLGLLTFTFHKPSSDAKLGIRMDSLQGFDGVVVAEITPGDVVAQSGVLVGDVIVRINGSRVSSAKAAAEKMRRATGPVEVQVAQLPTFIVRANGREGKALGVDLEGTSGVAGALSGSMLAGIPAGVIERSELAVGDLVMLVNGENGEAVAGATDVSSLVRTPRSTPQNYWALSSVTVDGSLKWYYQLICGPGAMIAGTVTGSEEIKV